MGLSVRVIDNFSVGRPENVPAEAELIQGDILNPAAIEKAVAGCDVVFHLAARVAIRSSFDFVVEDTATNFAGTASVCRATLRSGSARKIISTSSMAVYSDAATPDPLSETHPTEPVSPYGLSKLGAERLTHMLAAGTGVDSVVLRLFNTYGPGQTYSPYVGVVTIFVNKLRNGEAATVFGDGEQARDFVHVEDVVSAFVCAMEASVTGETCNIGTGRATTVNDVYKIVSSYMGVDRNPEHCPAVAGELRYSIADIAKARRILHYEPQHRFEASIGAVIDEIMLQSKAAK